MPAAFHARVLHRARPTWRDQSWRHFGQVMKMTSCTQSWDVTLWVCAGDASQLPPHQILGHQYNWLSYGHFCDSEGQMTVAATLNWVDSKSKSVVHPMNIFYKFYSNTSRGLQNVLVWTDTGTHRQTWIQTCFRKYLWRCLKCFEPYSLLSFLLSALALHC